MTTCDAERQSSAGGQQGRKAPLLDAPLQRWVGRHIDMIACHLMPIGVLKKTEVTLDPLDSSRILRCPFRQLHVHDIGRVPPFAGHRTICSDAHNGGDILAFASDDQAA
jgi:hypothetical protein